MKKILLILSMFVGVASVYQTQRNSKTQVLVVPGKSIASIELGMSKEKVISVLGIPVKEISSNNLMKDEFQVLGGRRFSGRLPEMTILKYSSPNLAVILEDNTVQAVQLYFTNNIKVKGYEFLKFKLLTKQEIDEIGKPSYVIRDKNAEQEMLKDAPKGTRAEFYVYKYDNPPMFLDLIFDRDKEKVNMHYIGLNSIALTRGVPLKK